MKLRISNMSLNNKSIINQIKTVIKKSKVLQLINLSWAQLSPENLADILKVIPDRLLSLRSLDLSYNVLNFNQENQEDLKNSTSFVN